MAKAGSPSSMDRSRDIQRAMTLIRSAPVRSTKHRPNRCLAGDESAKRQLQRGMARVALRHTREGTATDGYGIPLLRAEALANSLSPRGLRRFAQDPHDKATPRTRIIGLGCQGCARPGLPHIWPCGQAA